MTDHQRADTVLPEHPAITPNLTKFVNEGITFTNSFCPSPHCCPARATFHSGLYPSRSGVWNNVCNAQALTRGLKKGVRLWSDDLAEAGYQMAWSGKWHVSVEESPKDHGWEKELYVTGLNPTENEIGWNRYREIAKQPEQTKRGEGEIIRPGYPHYKLYGTRKEKGIKDAEKSVDEAIKILPELANKETPWSLFISMSPPHDPYFPPKKYLDLYDIDKVQLPPSFEDTLKDKPRIYQRMRRQMWGQLTEREIREGIRHFWALCTYLDDLFGKVLSTLESTGQAENTLVLYCSDHGDYCGDHGLFSKGIPCFRGAYNVPSVIRWPAGIKNPGQRIDKFVSLSDFAPTFIELAGVKTDRDFSGSSLVPFLRGENPTNWRKEIFTQCNGVELYFTQRSVMTKDYKYVFNGFDEDELYDLKKDPHEMKNVVEDPEYQSIKRELIRRMWQFAYREKDSAISSYITVGIAPYGPAEGFKSL